MGKDKLIEALVSMGYEEGKTIFLQGTYPQDKAYPNSFWTFWNVSTPEDSFFDNEPNTALWIFNLSFYSNDPVLVNSEIERAKPILKKAGFVTQGKGGDAKSDYAEWTGRNWIVTYLEKY